MQAPVTWNDLSTIFNVDSQETVDPRAADNILIAWPVLFDMLQDRAKADILDFGCGTGAFAKKLSALGHTVKAIDPAANMIAINGGQAQYRSFKPFLNLNLDLDLTLSSRCFLSIRALVKKKIKIKIKIKIKKNGLSERYWGQARIDDFEFFACRSPQSLGG